MDFNLRKAGEPLTFPNRCICCHAEGASNDLIDTHSDAYTDGPGGGTAQGRIFLCLRCLKAALAALGQPVVPIADLHVAQRDVDRLVAERNARDSELAALRQLLRDETTRADGVTAELASVRSAEGALAEAIQSMRAENQERRLNGGKTSAEVEAELVAAAVTTKEHAHA
jgi:hypothetical protein